ncbi:MAG: PIN domain-containing protein [bacterium]
MKSVLLDTSVWIQYFQESRGFEGDIVERLIKEGLVCATGIVVTELLSGVKNISEKEKLTELLRSVPFLPVGYQIWWDAGEYRYAMKRKGFNASLPDVVISAVAIHYDVELFSLDRYFLEIAKFIPLKMMREIV